MRSISIFYVEMNGNKIVCIMAFCAIFSVVDFVFSQMRRWREILGKYLTSGSFLVEMSFDLL